MISELVVTVLTLCRSWVWSHLTGGRSRSREAEDRDRGPGCQRLLLPHSQRQSSVHVYTPVYTPPTGYSRRVRKERVRLRRIQARLRFYVHFLLITFLWSAYFLCVLFTLSGVSQCVHRRTHIGTSQYHISTSPCSIPGPDPI